MSDFCGGVDVGGTKISSALFTNKGEMLAKSKVAIDQVAAAIRGLERAAADEGGLLLAAGVSIPGIVYSESGRVWAPNIPGWDRYPLLDRLERESDEPELADIVLVSDR